MHTTASRASTAALLRALCHWAYNPQSSPSTQMACGVACHDRTAALAVPSGLSHTGWQSAVTALLAQLCADGAAAVASDAYCALVQQDRVAGSAAPHSGACRALLSQHSLGRSARPARVLAGHIDLRSSGIGDVPWCNALTRGDAGQMPQARQIHRSERRNQAGGGAGRLRYLR